MQAFYLKWVFFENANQLLLSTLPCPALITHTHTLPMNYSHAVVSLQLFNFCNTLNYYTFLFKILRKGFLTSRGQIRDYKQLVKSFNACPIVICISPIAEEFNGSNSLSVCRERFGSAHWRWLPATHTHKYVFTYICNTYIQYVHFNPTWNFCWFWECLKQINSWKLCL